jgi:hypothetical protein
MSEPQPTFKPVREQFAPFFERDQWVSDDEYRRVIRELCIRAIYARWSTENQPSDYQYIKNFVLQRMDDLPRYRMPDDETLGRRIRETVDPKLFPLGITPCVRLREGVYLPNPALFMDEERDKLEKMLKNQFKQQEPLNY